MKLPLLPKRPEVQGQWWHRLAEVFVLGATALALLLGILIASEQEDKSPIFWFPIVVYLIGAGLYHTALYIGFGPKKPQGKNVLQKSFQQQKEVVEVVSSKADKVALHIKWCNVLFLGGVLAFILGASLKIDALNVIGGFALLGVLYCVIALEIMVWKSGWKYVAIISLLLGGVIGIGAFFCAYADAIKMVKKAGYTVGLLGPREINFWGQKIKALSPVKAEINKQQMKSKPTQSVTAKKQNGYFSHWLVKVDSIEGAKKATAQGYGIAYFVAILTGIIALIAMTTGESIGGIDAYAIVDVLLMALAGLGMQFYSRIAAVGALVLFVLGKAVMLSEGNMSAGGWVMGIIIIFAFINGIRGTFAYQNFRQLQHANRA